MAEYRRLLIDPKRISTADMLGGLIQINQTEIHYLRKVLRLKPFQKFGVVDGVGHLWEASLKGSNCIRLHTSLNAPVKSSPRIIPLIGLAVVIPKRDFDSLLRMCCELGVDLFLPLSSDRSAPFLHDKSDRWELIFKEAVEQSERLWKPSLLKKSNALKFFNSRNNNSSLFLASTRLNKSRSFLSELSKADLSKDIIWVAIGPEGGWTEEEQESAIKNGWNIISFGDNILRTSTASVVATQMMSYFRDKNFNNSLDDY